MNLSTYTKILPVLLMVIVCLCMSMIKHASVTPTGSGEDYEAKKSTYRAQLMADDVTSDDLLIGSWISFYSFDIHSYEYQLDQMAAAGINFNIFPYSFDWRMHIGAATWADVEVQYAKRNMVYLIDTVLYSADKEHCIGYYIMDEPTGDELPDAAEMIRLYRDADKTRYPFVNLFPSGAGEHRLGSSYFGHVSRFVELAGAENIEYLSHDYYPFHKHGTDMGIFTDMEVIRSIAYENGKLKTHAFPQSSAWNGTHMPNIHEMRWNVYAYLAYGFKGLSWFNLVCPGESDAEGEGYYESLIYRDGTIRDPELFAAWSDLNWEARGLSSVLMNLDTVHAYHTNKSVAGVEYLPEDFFIQPKYNGENFIISVMEPKKGDDFYIMLFNNDHSNNNTTGKFLVSLPGNEVQLEYFDPFTGEYVPLECENGNFVDTFRPGEGKLYRLPSTVTKELLNITD